MKEREAIALFDDFLDETQEPVRIIGFEYAPSRVLKEIDETVYRITFYEWLDAENIDVDE